ncbi:type VI secretion system tube protein Hcp [Parapedobacter tibetensis]|uniref:type VI secretion system tube protein Hcp n=1 Tax=Parapedobacter tibetensis TaxID=2972951 RepID=UPI00214D43C8|nr:type VI secretion system tube protein Hcp [Parapedobacter tibetensis]
MKKPYLIIAALFIAAVFTHCEKENTATPRDTEGTTCVAPIDAIAQFLELETTEEKVTLEIFLKLKNVDGEVTDDSHKGEINILSLDWDTGIQLADEIGGRESIGKKVQSFNFKKYKDKTTPVLKEALSSQKIFPEVLLSIRKITDGQQQKEMKIKLRDVVISSISAVDTQGDDVMPIEQIDLGSWSKVEGLDVSWGKSGF